MAFPDDQTPLRRPQGLSPASAEAAYSQFTRPDVQRTTRLLSGQPGPGAATLANGRSPAFPPPPAVDAPNWSTARGAQAPSNGIPFQMPPEAPSLTTSPGAQGGPHTTSAIERPMTAAEMQQFGLRQPQAAGTAFEAPMSNTQAKLFGLPTQSGGSAERAAFRSPPNSGPQMPGGAVPEAPGGLRGTASRVFNAGSDLAGAGAKVGQAAADAGSAVGGAAKNAGLAVGSFAKSAVGPALRGASNFLGALPHAAAYVDDAVPFPDKLRIGATDLTRAGGAFLGGAFGAGVGTVLPGPGTLVGGIAGGMGGDWAGHKAGNAIFSGDEALKRNGYDPERGIVDVAKDAFAGKGANAVLGGRAVTATTPTGGLDAGAGRGFVNPGFSTEAPVNPNDPYAAANAAKLAVATAPAAPVPAAAPQDPSALRRVDGGSSPLFTNLPDGGMGGNEALMGRGAVSAQNQGAAQALSDRYAAEGAASLRPPETGPTMSVMGGGGYGLRDPAYLAARNAAVSAGGISGSGLSARQRAANQIAKEQNETARMQLAETGRNNQAQDATAQRGQDVQLRGHQMQNDVALRGQDVTREGHLLTNSTARTRLQYDMGKDQRDYTATRGDKASEKDATLFAQGQTARTNDDKALDGMFTSLDGDGKPVVDGARKGQFQQMEQQQLGRVISQLQRTGTTAALREAERISRGGPSVMDAEDRARNLQRFRMHELATQTHGPAYGSSNHKPSAELEGYDVDKVENGRAYLKNGTVIHEEKLKYGKDGNTVLPNLFKKPTAAYGN